MLVTGRRSAETVRAELTRLDEELEIARILGADALTYYEGSCTATCPRTM